MTVAAKFVLFALSFTVALATIGVDISTPISESAFHCLREKGYSFAVARVSGGAIAFNNFDTLF